MQPLLGFFPALSRDIAREFLYGPHRIFRVMQHDGIEATCGSAAAFVADTRTAV